MYNTYFLYLPQQNDWPDCERLAANMHFHFPECQKIDLNALISRASANGIQLLEKLLQWDPERRPTAQQALKYPFFQILVRTTDTGYVSLPDTQISHHNNDFNTRQTAKVMRYGSLDNEQWAKETAEFALRLGSSKQALLSSSNTSASKLSGDILKKNTTENGKFFFVRFVSLGLVKLSLLSNLSFVCFVSLSSFRQVLLVANYGISCINLIFLSFKRKHTGSSLQKIFGRMDTLSKN